MSTTLPQAEWQRLQETFLAATELEGARRRAYVAEVEKTSPELLHFLEELLTTLDSDTKIDRAIGAAAAHITASSLYGIGDLMGPYRLIGILGHGGMGVVYKATRIDGAYRKDVAIKVAGYGMSLPHLSQRFERERQILANLDHPNIARIMDGGTTPNGAPYVVMEFICGEPIDKWCDRMALPKLERVKLVIEVARAVNYAHRHLVVHRDLKPDNIYVMADGVPKLLDFGIAKALDPDGAGVNPLLTVSTDCLMTPSYASPEQVRGGIVTTGTDVYQLGVLLFQLLTGKLPFEVSLTRMVEFERIICERPAPKPSVDEDVDRIILQALEKEPAQRYQSAGDLADDLERSLQGFPILAHSPSWTYRARKFILRNKLPVSSALVALLLLLGFGAAMMVQNRRLKRERNTAQRVSQFLETVFSAGNPEAAGGKNPTARQLLDTGAATIAGDRQMDLEVRDRLLNTLGKAYRGLGIYDRAYDLFSDSLRSRRILYGAKSSEVAETMGILTDLDIYQEDYGRADRDAKQWFALIKPLDSRHDEETWKALKQLAAIQMYQNNLSQAEVTQRKAIDVASKVFGPRSPQVYMEYIPYGNLLRYRGKLVEAEGIYRSAIEGLRKDNSLEDAFREIHLLEASFRLGSLLGTEERLAEAEPLLRQTLQMRLKILGPDHESTGTTEVVLGRVLSKIGQTQEAERLAREGLRARAANTGTEFMHYGTDEGLLANIYLDNGEYELAKPLMLHQILLCRKHLGEESPYLARAMNDLGRLQTATGQLDAASQTLQSALAMEVKLNGDNSPYAADDHLAIGKLLLEKGNLPEAEASLRRALAIYHPIAQVTRPGTVSALSALATILRRQGHMREGQALLSETATLQSDPIKPVSKMLPQLNSDVALRR